MTSRPALLCLAVLPVLAAAATTRDDYAHGILLTPSGGLPLQELPVPDEVYANVLHPDLSDARVFSGAGVAVPHVICPPPPPPPPTVSQQPLDLYLLQRGAIAGEPPSVVRVETAAGSEITVTDGAPAAPQEAIPQAYVIDARPVPGSLRSLRLNWSSPDGASEVEVLVETSDDLDRWTRIVGRTRLVAAKRVGADGALERSFIGLIPGTYSYIRLERADGGPPLKLESVMGESTVESPEEAPTRFVATQLAHSGTGWTFDSGRQAPVGMAQIVLPLPNMSVQVALASRPDTPDPAKPGNWREHWRGEVTTVTGMATEWPIRFDTTPDRWWRVQVLSGADTLGQGAPALNLGYRPARLRFLAQGDSAHTLAFGSARAERHVAECRELLGNVTETQRKELTGQLYERSAMRELGGKLALLPEPEKTPVRLYVLWGTLIVGAGLIGWMGVSLLRQLRSPSE